MASETDAVLIAVLRTFEDKDVCRVTARLDMFSAWAMTGFAGDVFSVVSVTGVRTGAGLIVHILVACETGCGPDKVGWGRAVLLLCSASSVLYGAFRVESSEAENCECQKQNEKIPDVAGARWMIAKTAEEDFFCLRVA